jgi:acetylglutamate kinase
VNPGAHGIDLFRAAPHVRLHRGRVIVIKVGGGTLARPNACQRLARQIAVVEALGSRLVVVHGGGPQTDAVQRALGEEPRMVDGRRITSETAMRALRTATDELNEGLVATLVAAGVPAVQIAGPTVLTAERRPPVPTSEGMVDFGLVGDVQSADHEPLLSALEAGAVPVVCPPAADQADREGGVLNVNADLVAASIAGALSAEKLVLMTGAPGVLSDPTDADSLLSALSLSELDALDSSGALEKGMSVKAAAIRGALNSGVSRVHVVSGEDTDALLRELYTNHGAGTLITRHPESAPTQSPLGLPV